MSHGRDPRSWSERLLLRAIGSREAFEGIVGDVREETARKGVQPGSLRFHGAILGVALRYLAARLKSRDVDGPDGDAGAAAGGDGSVAVLIRDVRIAIRSLARTPGFTLVVLVTVAVGVGATTAVFSVVNGVLLRPLPYPDGDELMRIHAAWEGAPVGDLSPGEHFDFADRLEAFEAFGTYTYGTVTLAGDDAPRRVPVAFVTAGVLEALGAEPVLGRVFGEGEDGPGSELLVVGHGFWQRELGADLDAVGRSVVLDGRVREVIGVLPPDFRLPEAVVSGRPVEAVVPLGLARADVQSHGSHFLLGLGRRRPGVSAQEARQDVARVGEWIAATFAEDYGGSMRFGAIPLAENLLGDARPALMVLFAAGAFVLLIACANTANLLLARAEARRRDHAIRSALGAGWPRIVGRVAVEALVLGLAGGAIGVALAYGAVAGLVALDPPDVPRLDDVSVNGTVLLFAVAVSVATGLLFGLLPALRMLGEKSLDALRGEGRGTGGGRRGQRSRRLLVVAETAFAVVLLTGALLFARSFAQLLDVDPGFEVDNVLTARLTAEAARYPGDPEVRAFYQTLETRLGTVPGVLAAGTVTNLPLDRELGDMGIEVEGRAIPPGGDKPAADWQVVTPGYFEALGTVLLRGRTFDDRDHAQAPGAAVVNETMAHRFWPEADPLGERFMLGGGAGPGWVTVVGVVRDVVHDGLDAGVDPQFFVPHRQFRFWNDGGAARSMSLVVRTGGFPTALAGDVRRTVAEVDPNVAVSDFRTMREVRSASVARPRFLVSLLGAFALVALVLASLGIYGVISYGVRKRSGEIGIRMALGAGASRVTGMVLGEGVRLVGSGLALGVVAALLLNRLISGLLYGVSPADPLTLAAVCAILGGVALIATWLPARRATRVDPAEVLRAE